MTPRKNINDDEAIGLLCNESITGLEDYQKRSELSLRHDITLLYIERNEENLNRIVNGEKILCRHWDGNSMIEGIAKIPSVIYDRVDVRSRKRKLTDAIIKALEERDADFVNPLKFRLMAADKWKQYQFFKASGIELPETQEYSEDSIDDLLNKYDTVFIKKKRASGGKSQYVIKQISGNLYTVQSSTTNERFTIKGLRKVIDYLDHKKITERTYIAQQGLNIDLHEGCVYDFRVLYHRGPIGKLSLTAIYMRIGIPESQQANVSKGGQFHDPIVVYEEPSELLIPLIERSNKIMDILNNKFIVGEIGLDFLPIDEGHNFMLCEVNSKPGSKAIEELCRWNPSDDMHQKNGITPYQYTNEDRERWGKIRREFRVKPIRYGQWLHQTNNLIE
ncbi:MAG: YheC/YheD family protein [Candidatus Woesearchaeota archaeon]